MYGNSGDWVEHQTAIVEQLDGTMVLYDNNQKKTTLTIPSQTTMMAEPAPESVVGNQIDGGLAPRQPAL